MDIKKNSLEIMNQFNNVVTNIEEIDSKLEAFKKDINTKLEILNTYNAYTDSLINDLKNIEGKEIDGRYVFNYDKNSIVGGNFDRYGQVVHAKFIRMPSNMFNFITESGAIFKNNARVEFYTNEDEKDCKKEYHNILKHESDPSKKDIFKTFDQDSITMAIEVDMGNIISNAKFNMIEICPYLQGSFNIETIRIYSAEQYYSQDLLMADTIIETSHKNVGNIRIALNKKSSLYRIEFDIKINYQQDGYPFGLKHIYLYDTDMNTANDKMILEVKSNGYINYIGDNLKLLTTQGTISTTASKYGINYYMFYSNGVLQNEISNPIARNIDTFYAEIPMTQPLIGIEFEDIDIR